MTSRGGTQGQQWAITWKPSYSHASCSRQSCPIIIHGGLDPFHWTVKHSTISALRSYVCILSRDHDQTKCMHRLGRKRTCIRVMHCAQTADRMTVSYRCKKAKGSAKCDAFDLCSTRFFRDEVTATCLFANVFAILKVVDDSRWRPEKSRCVLCLIKDCAGLRPRGHPYI